MKRHAPSSKRWFVGCALALGMAWHSVARAEIRGRKPTMVAEFLIPDLGIVLDSDSPNLALALPIQLPLWARRGACGPGGCPYLPWVVAILEPQWATGGHGFALLAGVRTYLPLGVRGVTPALSFDVAAVGESSGPGLALGAGPSLEADPFMQSLTPRYRFVWSAEPRHEIYLDLASFVWFAG